MGQNNRVVKLDADRTPRPKLHDSSFRSHTRIDSRIKIDLWTWTGRIRAARPRRESVSREGLVSLVQLVPAEGQGVCRARGASGGGVGGCSAPSGAPPVAIDRSLRRPPTRDPPFSTSPHSCTIQSRKPSLPGPAPTPFFTLKQPRIPVN